MTNAAQESPLDRKKRRAKEWYTANRSYVLKAQNERRSSDPGRYADAQRKHALKRYGLTPESFALLLKKQRGRCAICRRQAEKTLHVDHCHKSLKVRGLLCFNCNFALGLLKDSAKIVSKMLDYLHAHN